MERRLAAVLAADVVGYSRLMAENEAKALESIRLLRHDLFEPEVTRWRGTVVKRLGDGWLVEFSSVVDAVECALAVQNQLSELNQVQLRVGVHIGDIVHESEDIYGDGVNIAARLESIGAAGHVMISDDVRRQIGGRVGTVFHEIGPVSLKNIAEPVRVWSWPAMLPDLATVSDAGQKPSIYVKQFEARGDEAIEFAEALRDDLATAFTRQSGLNLRTGDDTADYIVSGAIRGARGRWRISASLTDRPNNQTVWSERFDENGSDLFDVQDRCLTRIAGAVRIRLPSLLADKLTERPLQSMSVEELLNHAMDRHFTFTKASWDLAASALEHVLRQDSENWMAMTMLCWNILSRSRIFGWSPSAASDVERARSLIEAARTLKSNSEVVKMVHGAFLFYVMRDHAAAKIETEESLKLHPDYYHAINLMSQIELFTGNLEVAAALASRSINCDAGHPYLHLYQRGAGYVHAVGGEYSKALNSFSRADRSVSDLPHNLIGIAVSAQLSGAQDKARGAIETLLARTPDFNLQECDPWPFENAVEWAPIRDALARSGAPIEPSKSNA